METGGIFAKMLRAIHPNGGIKGDFSLLFVLFRLL